MGNQPNDSLIVKVKNLSLFTQPHVVLTSNTCFLLWNTKSDVENECKINFHSLVNENIFLWLSNFISMMHIFQFGASQSATRLTWINIIWHHWCQTWHDMFGCVILNIHANRVRFESCGEEKDYHWIHLNLNVISEELECSA